MDVTGSRTTMHSDDGVLAMPILETPFAVVDMETTGLFPRHDRVVEIAVRRFDPRSGEITSFESLVNPLRPMGAMLIHGIADEFVQDAPTFEQLAGAVLDLIAGTVVTSYNIQFDAGFLEAELQRVGIEAKFPQLCLMLLKPMLGLGPRAGLRDACHQLSISVGSEHAAWSDAEAAERLLRYYLAVLAKKGARTFADLLPLAPYRFLTTLERVPLAIAFTPKPAGATTPISRRGWPPERRAFADKDGLRAYFNALTSVMTDLHITDEEFAYMKDLQRKLSLRKEQIRALHTRAFLCFVMNFVGDDWLDDTEVSKLQQASACLAELGWAPIVP